MDTEEEEEDHRGMVEVEEGVVRVREEGEVGIGGRRFL